MTMSKNLSSYIGVKVADLKVLCGLSLNRTAHEERELNNVVPEPIPSWNFLTVYKQKQQRKQMAEEFEALSRHQEEHSTNAALRNVLLNVKHEIIPYDHSRVIVWDRPDTVGTDYYNASYIDGYNFPKEYIASQGPTNKSLVSFWHMIWQENITHIVMATGLFDNAMQQCEKYWADKADTHVQHGFIHIWHESSKQLSQLNIRTLRVQKDGGGEWRVLTHYEMVGFHEENPDPGLLLDVRRRVNSVSRPQSGPLLVHCRCGGGRAAVFIALDICLHQLSCEARVDVYATVLHLRRFRKNMVRTLNQYMQIYRAVAMHVQCGLTVYPAAAFPQVFHGVSGGAADSKHSHIEKEFQILHSIVTKLGIGDCASGHRVENRSKSRDIMMLPPERARPYLTTIDCGEGGTDFINAVYVDGYHAENTYIVTQWPMKKTLSDLWRMVFDYKISSIVTMNDPLKVSRSYPSWWPNNINQVTSYGPVNVRYLSCDRQASLVTRTFAIRKIMNNAIGRELRQDESVVKIFLVLSMPRRGSHSVRHAFTSGLCSNNKPHSRSRSESGTRDRERGRRRGKAVGILSRSLLSAMEHVDVWQKCNKSRQPICVISKDGCSHVGMYCALAVCLDQMREEGEVDVFNTVRMVRRHRPQLVPSIEEYRYIYFFITELVNSSWLKPNFTASDSITDVMSHSRLDHSTLVAQVFNNSSNSNTSVSPNKHSVHGYKSKYIHDPCFNTERSRQYPCLHIHSTDACFHTERSRQYSCLHIQNTDADIKCTDSNGVNMSYAKRGANSRTMPCSNNFLTDNNRTLPPAFEGPDNTNRESLYHSSMNGNINTANTHKSQISAACDHSLLQQILSSDTQTPVRPLYVGNNDSGVIVLIHASYASMGDTSDSSEERERRSSFDSVNT